MVCGLVVLFGVCFVVFVCLLIVISLSVYVVWVFVFGGFVN